VLLVLQTPSTGRLCVHVAQGLPHCEDALLTLADLTEEASPAAWGKMKVTSISKTTAEYCSKMVQILER